MGWLISRLFVLLRHLSSFIYFYFDFYFDFYFYFYFSFSFDFDFDFYFDLDIFNFSFLIHLLLLLLLLRLLPLLLPLLFLDGRLWAMRAGSEFPRISCWCWCWFGEFFCLSRGFWGMVGLGWVEGDDGEDDGREERGSEKLILNPIPTHVYYIPLIPKTLQSPLDSPSSIFISDTQPETPSPPHKNRPVKSHSNPQPLKVLSKSIDLGLLHLPRRRPQ